MADPPGTVCVQVTYSKHSFGEGVMCAFGGQTTAADELEKFAYDMEAPSPREDYDELEDVAIWATRWLIEHDLRGVETIEAYAKLCGYTMEEVASSKQLFGQFMLVAYTDWSQDEGRPGPQEDVVAYLWANTSKERLDTPCKHPFEEPTYDSVRAWIEAKYPAFLHLCA